MTVDRRSRRLQVAEGGKRVGLFQGRRALRDKWRLEHLERRWMFRGECGVAKKLLYFTRDFLPAWELHSVLDLLMRLFGHLFLRW